LRVRWRLSTRAVDGPRNLLNAIGIATTPEARGKGVMLAMNNQINAPRSVTKTHTGDVETRTSRATSAFWAKSGTTRSSSLAHRCAGSASTWVPQRWRAERFWAMFGGADGSLLRYAVDQGA
jgi:L-asparaginase